MQFPVVGSEAKVPQITPEVSLVITMEAKDFSSTNSHKGETHQLMRQILQL